MYKGSCLCGAVRYELNDDINELYFCHCSICRKANGSAFSAVARVNTSKLFLISGGKHLKKFYSSEGAGRYFCEECGSPLFSRRDLTPEVLGLRIGTLDSSLSDKPIKHVFTGSKASWYPICDNNAQYEELP